MENTGITITFEKLYDNIKRFFWVIVGTMLLGVLICIFLTFSSDAGSDKQYALQKVFAIHKSNEEVMDSSSTENILSDITLLSNTNNFTSALEEEMKNRGFSGYLFSMDDSIHRSISGNVMVFNFQASSQKEVEILSEIYSSMMIENMNNILDDKEIVLNSELSETSAKIISTSAQESNLLSVKNIFIISLSLLAGLIIIFILTIADKYVRNKDEIVGLENVIVLGILGKGVKDQFKLMKTVYCTKQYIENKKIQQLTFLSFGSNNNVNKTRVNEFLSECKKVFGENVKINYCNNILENYNNIDQIVSGVPVVFLNVNVDKYHDVSEGINLLTIAGKQPEAVVYIG